MKKYNRSICSTCGHLTNCVLTTDKSNISSCSEYIHIADIAKDIELSETVQMFSSTGTEEREKELTAI